MTDQATGLPETAAPSAAYVEQMTSATHGDPVPVTPPAAPEVPAKFKNADGSVNTAALLASYSELEKKQSAGKPAEAAAETPAAAPEAAAAAAAEATPGAKIERKAEEAAPAPSPLTDAVAAVRTAYEAGGEVTPELIKPLTDAGLPQEMIETYFAGLKAIESTIELAAHTAAGGKDKFEAMRAWAGTALSDADLDYYNGQASNPATAKQAVEWLSAKHAAANPSEGTMIETQPGATGGGDTFSSQHEVTKAMSDPQYKVSPAYREQIAHKLQRSIKAGTIYATAEFHSR